MLSALIIGCAASKPLFRAECSILDASFASWKVRHLQLCRIIDWIGWTAVRIPISSSSHQSGNSEWNLGPQLHREIVIRDMHLYMQVRLRDKVGTYFIAAYTQGIIGKHFAASIGFAKV